MAIPVRAEAKTFGEGKAPSRAGGDLLHGIDRVSPSVNALVGVPDQNHACGLARGLFEDQCEGDGVGVLGFIEEDDVVAPEGGALQGPEFQVAVMSHGQLGFSGILHALPESADHGEHAMASGFWSARRRGEMSRKGLLIGGVQKGIEGIDDVDSEGGGGEVEGFHHDPRSERGLGAI
jgi:hypothetical protein